MGGLGPNDKLEIETKGAKDERVKSYAKLVISCHCSMISDLLLFLAYLYLHYLFSDWSTFIIFSLIGLLLFNQNWSLKSGCLALDLI